MRRAVLLLAAGLVGAAWLEAQALPPQGRDVASPAGTATLDGVVTVTAAGLRAPVRRARVVASTTLAQQTTDTDTNGRFHLDHLVAGRYKIVVNKFGFVPDSQAAVVDLAAGARETVSVPMVRGAAIEGRLTTDAGEPAIGLTVSAGQLGYGPYGRIMVATTQAITDDLGRFRIHTLPAGDYYLQAQPDPIRMLQVSAPEGPIPKPALSYYSGGLAGTARLNEARIVTLGVAQQATGVDFSMVSSVLATLSVRVASASGAAPAGSAVRVQRVGGPTGEVRCLLLPNGPAHCRNVPPGDYWVLAVVPSVAGSAREFAADRVTVNGQDQTVTATTAPGVAVSGQLEADAGTALPTNLHLQVVALETAYEVPTGAPGQPAPATSVAVADGAFTFPDLFGPRLLRVMGLPDGWAVKAVRLGSADVTDTPTAIAGGQPITVVLTQQTGSVVGTVTDTSGHPAVGSRVVVFSADARTWGARSRFIATAEVGPAGQYAVHSLLPGRYVVAAVPHMPDGSWEDPERLAQLQPTATPVTVSAGATATADWRPR